MYEVWDFETRNIINSCDSEGAALAFVRRLYELNGPGGVRELGILRQDLDESGEYEPTLIAEGSALLMQLLAEEAPAARRVAS